MGRTVGELEAGMSAAEFTDWVRYHAVEPFGEERGDLRAGIVASVLANIHRPPTRAPFSPSDFMPYGERAAQREPDPLEFFGKF